MARRCRRRVLLAGAMLATIGWQTFGRPAAPAVERVSLALPADRAIVFFWFPNQSIAISPDGAEVVYVSANPGAPRAEHSASSPFTRQSHDPRSARDVSRSPAVLFARRTIRRVFHEERGTEEDRALRRQSVTLADKINASRFTFGVWLRSGTIVFGGHGTAGLAVPAGGSPTTLTSIDVAQGEIGHYPSSYAPEAGALVFASSFSQLRSPRLEAVILQSGERRVITENASKRKYLSTGTSRSGAATRCSSRGSTMKRLALVGPAAVLSDDVRRDGANSEGTVLQLAVSSNGTLAYVPRADATARVMGRVGRPGIHALRTGRWCESATRLARWSACDVRIGPVWR